MALRFLIADDNTAHQRLIATTVAKLGGESVAASNGREVLDQALAEDFDVILLDMWMPQMGGARAASQLLEKFINASKRPRIIAMTGDVSAERRALCRAVGMDGFIPKPCDNLSLSLQKVITQGHCWSNGPARRLLDLARFWESVNYGDRSCMKKFEGAVHDMRDHFHALFAADGHVGAHAEALEAFAREHGFLHLGKTMDAIVEAAKQGEVSSFYARIGQEQADFELILIAARESIDEAKSEELLFI